MSHEQIFNKAIEYALNQLKAAQGANFVWPTDAQLVTAVGTLIYNELVSQGVV